MCPWSMSLLALDESQGCAGRPYRTEIETNFIMRIFASVMLGSLILISISEARAQVYKEIQGCVGSVKVVIACVVIERGVEKVVNVALDKLVAYIFSGKGIDPVPTLPPSIEAEAVRAAIVPWPEFKTFLMSALGKEPEQNPAKLRQKIGEACAAKYSPICAQFGFLDINRFRSCNGLTREACIANPMTCTWTASTCRSGGTKELFNR